MTSSLSNLADNVAEGIYRIKCKYRDNDKKKQTNCGIKCKGYECFLEYTNFKNSLIKYEFWCYNKDYQTKLVKT